MDPKQTPPLGNAQTGGQEGQPAGAPTSGATSGVFKMAGDLGAENLSTGANVSRTMDSLNNANQSATGAPVFAKHKFDKIEYATGDIIVDNNDAKPKSSFFGFFGSSKNNGPKVKSAAEITREARREAKRLRKLNAGKGNGSMVEPASAATAAQPVPAPAASTPTPAPTASTAPTSASKPQTTKRTKLIVGALVAILIIAASILGVIVLTSNNSTNTKRPTASTAISAKDAFTDYLSYLFYGDNVPNGDLLTNFKKTWEAYDTEDWLYDDEGNLIENAKNPIYAEQMMDLSSMNPARAAYFEELNEKWLTFLGAYNGEYQDTPRPNDISLYFYDLAEVGNLADSDILSIYAQGKDNITNDSNPVLERISNLVKYERGRKAAQDYLSVLDNYIYNFLNMLNDARTNNCYQDSSGFADCDYQNFDSYQKYLEAVNAKDNFEGEIIRKSRNDAYKPLYRIYQEVLNLEDAEAESDTALKGVKL